MNTCDFDQNRVLPIPEGQAAIAFRVANLNLTGYQQMVLIARGNKNKK